VKDVKDITACVIDHGLFLPLALKLGQTYKRVLYWTPADRDFPILNEHVIGDGYEHVERCRDFWEHKKEIDLFIFPDVQHSGLQLELESQGFLVWGSRTGDELELNREFFHRQLGDYGLEVPKYVVVVGLTELRQHLREVEDKYLKVSRYRGSFETVHWRNWREDEGMLDVWAVHFGPIKELVRFLVFDAIETDLEIGGDTYSIDGKFPKKLLHGLELKDKGYLAAVTDHADMPEQVRAVNEAFAPFLAEHRYRNLWSVEVRVKGDHSYFIDPCCRFPCPANGSQLALWKNLPEIIAAGSAGELVEPDPAAKFAAECVLTVKGEKDAWRIVDVPAALKGKINFRGSCELDGRICLPPHEAHGDEVGWLVATGDTLEDLVATMKEQMVQLPDGVSANAQSLFDLLKEVQTAEKEGIEFTDQKVPKPEMALKD